MYQHLHVDISVYVFKCFCIHICTHICMCFIFKIDLLCQFFKDTECRLLIMCKEEVSISDSLILPPFSNQVVK